MTAATERIPVLVTANEKAMIAKLAKDAHLSMGEFLRRAAASFRPGNEEVLDGMIDQMLKTTTQASAAIDDALAYIEASNERIAMLQRAEKDR